MAKNTNQTIKQLTKIVADNPSSDRKQTEKRLKKDFQDWLKRFQATSQQSTKKVSARERRSIFAASCEVLTHLVLVGKADESADESGRSTAAYGGGPHVRLR